MKKIFLILAACAWLLACNEQKEKEKSGNTGVSESKDSTGENQVFFDDTTHCPFDVPDDVANQIDSCNESGMGNLIISPRLAGKMIGNFITYFKKTPTEPGYQPNLATEYWVDSSSIFEVEKYFNQTDTAEGAWIIFGALDNGANTKIYIAPTGPKHKYGGSYVYYSNWGATSTIYGRLPASSAGRDCFETISYMNKIDVFRRSYRKEGTSALVDSLSKKVWIHKCVFKSLAKLIRYYASSTLTPKLDGVMVCSAAYDTSTVVKGVPGRLPTIAQSTIILTPTFLCKTGNTIYHSKAWNINAAFYKYYAVKKGLFYNHGELCPNACGADY